MGIDKLEIEKHIIEHEILKTNLWIKRGDVLSPKYAADKVGINRTNPQGFLDVNGDVYVGNNTAGATDYNSALYLNNSITEAPGNVYFGFWNSTKFAPDEEFDGISAAIAGYNLPNTSNFVGNAYGLLFGNYNDIVLSNTGNTRSKFIGIETWGAGGFIGKYTADNIRGINSISLTNSVGFGNLGNAANANFVFTNYLNSADIVATSNIITESVELVEAPAVTNGASNIYQSTYNGCGSGTGQFFGGYLGEEILTGADSTVSSFYTWSGTDWTRYVYSGIGVMMHTTGASADVVVDTGNFNTGVIRSGCDYRFLWRLLTRNGGNVTPRIGTASGISKNTVGWYSDIITALEDDADISFTPNITFSGGVTQIYVSQLQNYNYARTYSPDESKFNIAIHCSGAGEEDIIENTPNYSKFNKGIIKPLNTKTSDYTITGSDYTILADANGTTVDISLPASPNTGQIYNVKCVDDTNTCQVLRNGGGNIDGDAADLTLIEDESVTLQYDGAGWWIL